MIRTTMGLVVSSLLLPSTLEAQKFPEADTTLWTILAVFQGADPKLLHERRAKLERYGLARSFAADVLSQYTGPELGTNRPGGRRSQAELDAFAEQLVALAIVTTPLESWADDNDPIAESIIIALRVAAKRDSADDPDYIPYSGAYDALRRLYESGVATPDDLIDVDPERGVRHMLDLFQEGKLEQLQACQVLRMAYDHGKVVARDDGTLGFEPGGLHSSRLMADVFREIRGERFVENPYPHTIPCYWVRAGRRERG